MKSIAISVFLCFCLSGASLSQRVATIAKQDPNAVAALQQSIAAMGGDAISEIHSIVARGTIAPAKDSIARAGNFMWEEKISPEAIEFRHELESGGGTRIVVSGHGKPQIGQGAKRRKLFEHATAAVLPFHVPGVVLARILADKTNALHLKENAVVNDTVCLHVQLTNDSDPIKKLIAQEDWYLDASSGLPVRVEYRVPSSIDPSDFLKAAEEFAAYKSVNGVVAPSQLTSFENGKIVSIATVNNLHINPSAVDSDFDLSEAN